MDRRIEHLEKKLDQPQPFPRWAKFFLHALEIDQGLLATTPKATGSLQKN